MDSLREVVDLVGDVEYIWGSVRVTLRQNELSREDVEKDFKIDLQRALSEISKPGVNLDQIVVNVSGNKVLLMPGLNSANRNAISYFLNVYGMHLRQYISSPKAE